MARNTYSNQLKLKIINDWRAGLSGHELSKKYSINRSVISRLISKFLQTGCLSPVHCGGRPRKTSRYEDSLIKREIQKDPTTSYGQIRNNLSLNIREKKIRRIAIEAELFSRRPAKKPFISAKNRKARLEFAKAHHFDWSVKKLKTVLFSDESKYNFKYSDRIRRMRRPKEERLNPMYCKATVKHGDGGIIVWGCFSDQGMRPIHHIDGIIDRLMYRDILRNCRT